MLSAHVYQNHKLNPAFGHRLPILLLKLPRGSTKRKKLDPPKFQKFAFKHLTQKNRDLRQLRLFP